MTAVTIEELNKMENDMVNAILKRTSKGNFLYESLRPLWIFTNKTGILCDWCFPSNIDTKRSCLSKIIRFLILFLAAIIILTMTIFELFQTSYIFNFGDWHTIDELIMYFIWLMPMVHTCFTFVYMMSRRRQLLDFFQRFHQLERQTSIVPDDIRKTRLIAYSIGILTSLLTLIGVCYMMIAIPEDPYFLTSYLVLSNTFSPPLLTILQILAVILVMVYQLVTDLMPTFVYYHCGAAIFAIRDEIGELLPSLALNVKTEEPNQKNDRRLHTIWAKYNNVRDLVWTANNLFGILMVIDYGMKFFMICLLAFAVMHNYFLLPIIDTLTPLYIAVCYLLRFVYCVLLKSNVNKAVKILLEGMTDWLRLCWFDLHTAQRKIYVAIQDQIGSDQLSANPFYLFDINPALLLAFFSLTATYIIILLQYK